VYWSSSRSSKEYLSEDDLTPREVGGDGMDAFRLVPFPKKRLWILFALLLAVNISPSSLENLSRNSNERFPAGETLIYEVQWEPPPWMFFFPSITAGDITLHWDEHVVHSELTTQRITATAVSSGFFPRLTGITVNDSFESVIDAEKFCSLQMTKKLREGKRQRDVFLTFDSRSRKGHYEAFDVSKSPKIRLKNEDSTDVPECVQDVLSAIYFARLQELKPDLQFPVTIGDDGRIREIQVKVLKAEPVDVLGRKNAALKLEANSVFGGLFKESGTFYVWVSDDAHKVPLKFEAKIKLGKVSGSLKQVNREPGPESSSKTP
jgi:hypothetical protein